MGKSHTTPCPYCQGSGVIPEETATARTTREKWECEFKAQVRQEFGVRLEPHGVVTEA